MVLVARELEVDGGIPEICAEDSDLSSSSSSPPILRGTLRAVVDFFMMVGLCWCSVCLVDEASKSLGFVISLEFSELSPDLT